MADLGTSYLGMTLKNPVIAGASQLTSRLDSIRRLEDAGAAAIVTASLFEEQIRLERHLFEEAQQRHENVSAEMITTFPSGEHAGPAEHLQWMRRTKEAVKIPVIGSLNAVSPEVWSSYATLVAQTGVDALELNFYARPTDFDRSGVEIEREQLDALSSVLSSVSIPVSVKLSLHYTNPLHFIKELDRRGVKGLVLFNRFFEPDIDTEKLVHTSRPNLSEPSDSRLPLRYAGMLHGAIAADVCASGGIRDGDGVARMLLAGASCVQVASAAMTDGPARLAAMLRELDGWVQRKGFATVRDFRGSLSRKETKDPWAYLRGQYLRVVMSRPS